MKDIKFRSWRITDSGYGFMSDSESTMIVLSTLIEKGTAIMQYTGLKDKKGVEIYEGDIVTYKVGTLLVKGPVYYNDDFAVWEKGNHQNLGSYKKSTEVIGNIHETPELLK